MPRRPRPKINPQQIDQNDNFFNKFLFRGMIATGVAISSYILARKILSNSDVDQGKKFTDDFLAPNCNSPLTLQEQQNLLPAFPNANFSGIKYLGLSNVRPTVNNCEVYDCNHMLKSVVEVYHKSNNTLDTKVQINNVTVLESTYNKCSSKDYECFTRTLMKQLIPFNDGATYNCIGHALGISKWLNPSEITAYAKKNESYNGYTVIYRR